MANAVKMDDEAVAIKSVPKPKVVEKVVEKVVYVPAAHVDLSPEAQAKVREPNG